MKKVVYGVDLKRVFRRKLVLGIADGWLEADGKRIYEAKDLRVGLFKPEPHSGFDIEPDGPRHSAGQQRKEARP